MDFEILKEVKDTLIFMNTEEKFDLFFAIKKMGVVHTEELLKAAGIDVEKFNALSEEDYDMAISNRLWECSLESMAKFYDKLNEGEWRR
ncbi:MAG: hypothetical protein MJY67_01725 [Bacteroidales bacterium]|nr:hypothetical protein [Bacteroidales bacterium]